jgi:Kef-type K+ transport system membrane component KefB
MPAITYSGLLIIALVAVAVPVVLALVPRLPVPGAVLEVIAGILIGPSLLGWVHLNASIEVVSDLGLGMLLFLAGLEIDIESLRGPLGRVAGWAFGGSVVLGLACGLVLSLAGAGARPVFLAVVLTSTSAGLLLPLLKDAGQERTPFGQLVMTAAALAEVATIMMLSLLYSATSKTSAGRLASLALFLALLAVIGLALGRVRNLALLDRMLDRLEDRSAQLRVRAALTLALAFAVLASRFGFASILGAFAAGLLVRTIDLTGRAPHPQFQTKLEGIGFGFLVPVFFITRRSGRTIPPDPRTSGMHDLAVSVGHHRATSARAATAHPGAARPRATHAGASAGRGPAPRVGRSRPDQGRGERAVPQAWLRSPDHGRLGTGRLDRDPRRRPTLHHRAFPAMARRAGGVRYFTRE